MAYRFGSLDEVRGALARSRSAANPFALLVGEGCSTTAGVPTAEELVFTISKNYPEAYRRAREKNLAACLLELTPTEQRALASRYFDRVQVNSAHLAIAQLLHAGYVDRILTTNFDPLLLRACALVGEFPAVYDLAMGATLGALPLAQPAVVYLRGQRTSLVHRPSEHALHGALREAGGTRSWLVVGYEGLHDPIFPAVAALPHGDHALYWIGAEGSAENGIPEHLTHQSAGTYVPGYTPDAFLVSLVRALGDFAEDFAEEYQEHPQAVVETLRPFRPSPTPQPKDIGVRALPAEFVEADRLAERAQIRAQREADTLFESAYARYGEASRIAPGDPEVYLHWGNALCEQAKGKTGAEAECLLSRACQKYSRAASLAPRDAQTEYLWGLALSRRAQLTRGETSQQLLRDAMVHLGNAEDRNPGSAAYVLACLSGASGDSTQVRLWLTRGKVAGTLPPPRTVQCASALQPFVHEPWFHALFA